MQTYRRKFSQDATVVEAVRLSKENVKEVAEWCTGREVIEHDAFDRNTTYVGLNLITWDGMKRASEGAWIIKDVLGDFHIREDHIFTTSFEESNG